MSSAPSVPGVEVGVSWLGGCEHVLTAGALELLAVPHGTFGQRRAELPESRWTSAGMPVWHSTRTAALSR